MRQLRVALLLLALALLAAALDREAGLWRYHRLSVDLASADGRVQALRAQISALESEREALEDDPFALERAIRESLDLALPGEVVVRFESPEGPLGGLP